MCGISGCIASEFVNLDSFINMNQIIRHRGPDDEGFVIFEGENKLVLGGNETANETWFTEGIYFPKDKIQNSNFKAKVAFGHRRLSILDLSPFGHQPMCDQQGNYWVTFNGEIYNFEEIRQELISLGHSFMTKSDTEVVITAYKQWGQACQEKFNGMWAFAIYDKQTRQLFLSRDRFGIKPLYYWFSPNGDFYFASEIKQFSVIPGWNAVANISRVWDYLVYSLTDHTPETMFKGVFQLPPGHSFLSSINEIISINHGKLNSQSWYILKNKTFKGSFEDAIRVFRDNFIDSIKLHLRADVFVGSALSGGLDSSSIVSYVNILLRKLEKAELQKTFSSCSSDPMFDERNWIDLVVNETGVDAHFVYPKGEDVFRLQDHIMWHMDEPYQSQSAFLGYHVFQESRKNNVLVLLNGQGADEYLSAYMAYRKLRLKKLVKDFNWISIFKEVKSIKEIANIFIELARDLLPVRINYKISSYYANNKKLLAIFRWPKYARKFIHPYLTNRVDRSSHSEISKYQLFFDPLQRYLRWEDRNSMAHSVEARVPFLDYRLVEFAHSLPIEYLDSPNCSKRILVEAMKGILPEEVRNRKDKKGFITPEQRWFLDDFKNEFIELFKENVAYGNGIIKEKEALDYLLKMQNKEIPFDYSYWRIIQLCIWMKVFNVVLE